MNLIQLSKFFLQISIVQMPLLGAAIMDTERMIPNSRSSQNGSSPGSGQSGPTYHNASAISSNSNSMMLQHNSNNTGREGNKIKIK